MSASQVMPAIRQSAPQQAEGSKVYAGHSSIEHRAVQVVSTTQFDAVVPGSLQIGHLLDPRLRVVSPFRVEFSLVEGQVVAEAVDFCEFGYGANSSEALRDLQHALGELYFELEAMHEKLGPDLLSVSEAMRARIHPVSMA